MIEYDSILVILGTSSLVICGILKICEFRYKRGYSHGFHSGVSHGLFKCHENINNKKSKKKTNTYV